MVAMVVTVTVGGGLIPLAEVMVVVLFLVTVRAVVQPGWITFHFLVDG